MRINRDSKTEVINAFKVIFTPDLVEQSNVTSIYHLRASLFKRNLTDLKPVDFRVDGAITGIVSGQRFVVLKKGII